MTDITPAIIKAEKITWDGVLHEVSFLVAEGSMTVILTAKEEVDAWLTRILLGLNKPDQGECSVFGNVLSSLPPDKLYELRQRIGIAHANGGLISNLKVWENVTLPLSYLGRLSPSQIEELGTVTLKRVGYIGRFMQLPGLTPFHQKKVAGLARAMVMNPELIIYESPLLGLNLEERLAYLKTAVEFHGEKEGRTSLFLSSSPDILPLIRNANVIDIRQELQS